jgi:AcrR family transcriptional regulator
MSSCEPDGRKRRGNESRVAVLDRAVQLASTQGLDGLSIGHLATEVGASKSGVIALFGTKLDLQLATIASAREVFIANVVQPALRKPRGLDRLWGLCQLWLAYSQRRVFEGGCFFRAVARASATHPAPVREALVAVDREWMAFLERAIELARDDLPGLGSAGQLAFEISAIMDGANNASLLYGSDAYYEFAEAALRDRLVALGADAAALAEAAAV